MVDDELKATAKLLAGCLDGNSVPEFKNRQSGVVVLDTTPFYAESGGQVGDQGVLVNGSAKFAVEDTLKIKADVYGHHGTLTQGNLAVGDHVEAQVDMAVRCAPVRHQTATHLRASIHT